MAEFTFQASCTDVHESQSLSVQEAKQRISKLVVPVDSWQYLALRESLGFILAQDIISPIDVPSHNNSAMDGYAVHGDDLINEATVKQVGIAFAGQPFNGVINLGECVRIMTGAMMPDDCDTVVMQEHVEIKGEFITLHGHQHVRGQNVRHRGEDLKTGEVVLAKDHKITPVDLGLIASLGIAEVKVKRKICVAFFSTGDELRSLGETLEQGQIFDSNRYTLYGMLKRLDVDIIDLGVIADNKDDLRQALSLASEQADVVITSGGVSVGDADYVKEILSELGQVDFWKLAMKPGRPLAFGKINNALFFGLPGNPVSVMVTFYQFVTEALQQLSGLAKHDHNHIQVNCVSKLHKRVGRFEFQRGILFTNEQGLTQVKTTGEQGSGILHSMSIANCFILLEEQCDGIEPNTLVTVQPFAGFI